MKIHPRHNKAVAEAGHQMRKVLTEQTIELLKLIGAEDCQDVLLNNLLIMHDRKKNGLTETILADRICYCDNGSSPYYLLECNGKPTVSYYMTLSNMETVYNEVYKVVRKH